jgi:signal-transduction protein with cAMP-binding, CBS, and nucleotidyltransferase domain
MKVKELHPRSVVTVESSDVIRIAIEELAREEVGAVAVFGSHGISGILSERDIVRAVADGVDIDETTVDEYMTQTAVTIQPERGVHEAMSIMSEFGCRHLLVEEAGDICGMISVRDIVAALGAEPD